MKTDDVFPSKYLKAGDLPEDGSEILTIEEIKVEEIGRNKEKKPVIHFTEHDRGMVCNKTNWNTIAKALGSHDSDDWIGKAIGLFRAEVEFQGEMVESIRVRSRTPGQPGASKNNPPPDNDEIPF